MLDARERIDAVGCVLLQFSEAMEKWNRAGRQFGEHPDWGEYAERIDSFYAVEPESKPENGGDR